MSSVISLRLPEGQNQRLKKYARRLGRTPSETGRILLDEALKQIEFAGIEFRDSPAGRQAYVRERRTPVWMVMSVARHYKSDLKKTSKHFQWPLEAVQSAFNYAKAFPDEIDLALSENDSVTFDELQRMLPSIRIQQFK